MTRRAPLPSGARGMVRGVLDQAAAALNAMAERGQQPMICSEFVYRCHREARPEAPYVLKIGADDVHDGAPTLLQWAQAQPNLGTMTAPARLAGFNPAKAETALAPLIAACTTITRQPGTPTAAAHAKDEELLASIGVFGAALHRARNQSRDAGPSLSLAQALETIHATHSEPDFVTPGDLARTPSLTEVHRHQDAATPVETASQLLSH